MQVNTYVDALSYLIGFALGDGRVRIQTFRLRRLEQISSELSAH